ncbi:MAG TPA: secondary thiamine-phosphate synthase enzyme YjbQ [Patescibacteria group bacterium]|nr:secondary thiamine-phosphate synthase enzyme YjbQ [Patescibacteria group bacterium]
MEKFNVKTASRTELVDITDQLRAVVARTKIDQGVCVVFCPHTTAGLTINENADPSVKDDIISAFNTLVPPDAHYTHAEGNADSHVKSSLFGASLTFCIEQGQLQLGSWQGVYLCESDGPRNRQVWVKALKG